ncbi:Bifunctional ligase/repressor BirA [Symmachiella macrocystis]|uniref:biotin--[biotin carboxyl-carrier protein] ligase n=1 Tax=Symmachiella macrocystis TaxID=2527985 RepID=A0A5C6BAE7_9PLAN|nr:biotin--[acetyl-CoA-carboxylase] ligase [Symmachiella macrocystis]TWU08687.1 Bifunctional ligase/repressor BirA [Symmachiella macrocystis]
MNPADEETPAAFDLDRIASETFIQSIDFHETLASTNDRGLQLANDPFVVTPSLVLTPAQTGGRGRGANRWWSTAGALTFSVLVSPDVVELPVARHPQISLTVGVAVCEALRQRFPQADIGLKWPNDVFLHEKKVCGILVEVPPQRRDILVIGIGLNVNNSLKSAPAELQATATSLSDAVGNKFELSEILIEVLHMLEQRLAWLSASDPQLARRWEEFSLLRGKTVYIENHQNDIAGICQGIDEEGGLLLRTPSGIERVTHGIVKHFQ